jgi:hypothetical protein
VLKGVFASHRAALLVPVLRAIIEFLLAIRPNDEKLAVLAQAVERHSGSIRYAFRRSSSGSRCWTPGAGMIDLFRDLRALLQRFGEITGYDVEYNYRESDTAALSMQATLPHNQFVRIELEAPVKAASLPAETLLRVVWNLDLWRELRFPARMAQVLSASRRQFYAKAS